MFGMERRQESCCLARNPVLPPGLPEQREHTCATCPCGEGRRNTGGLPSLAQGLPQEQGLPFRANSRTGGSGCLRAATPARSMGLSCLWLLQPALSQLPSEPAGRGHCLCSPGTAYPMRCDLEHASLPIQPLSRVSCDLMKWDRDFPCDTSPHSPCATLMVHA